MSRVEFVGPFEHHDVVVRGRRVPFLSASFAPGGKTLLTFDRRLGLELGAENYERVTEFIADVIENCLHPQMGRTFNRLSEITAVSGDPPEAAP